MVGVIASLVERLKKWKANDHEEKVEQAIDRLMLVETFLFWYIQELEDLKTQLSTDPVLILLVPIVEVMISQLWQLMKRWAKVKAEVIREARKGLMKKERKIEGNGFTAHVKYSKHVIDLKITLHGGHGDNVRIPDLGIDKNVLKAMRIGWRASDSSHEKDKNPILSTAFVWQVIAWLILYPNDKANIYANGVNVSLDDVKPIWELRINGVKVEWLSDVEAYQEMIKLPRNLFVIAAVHAIIGDGNSKVDNGYRRIILVNNDRGVLELVAKRIENELKINKPVSPHENVWYYWATGEDAKAFAEVAVKVLEEVAPQAKALYDLLADGSRYTLIWFRKWAELVRASVYVFNELKVEFAGITWTPHFKNSIELRLYTEDVNYAEGLRRRLEAQGIDAVITKYINKKDNTTYYDVKIKWSVLQRYLCNEELRNALIRAAMKSIENCKVKRMMGKAKKDCSQIPAAQCLRKLTDPQWLREYIGCQDPAQRGPGPNPT